MASGNEQPSSSWKGKEKEDDEQGIPPELMASTSTAPQPLRHTPQPIVDIDKDSGMPLSKDHITSSFDKATALSDRNYFNKIMNDHQRPVESQEEILNKEKYEQAKNRFDELYRDILATEDLKNHPELIEELNRLSASGAFPPLDQEQGPTGPMDPMDQLRSPQMASPPPPSQMNYGNNASSYASKEDYIHSLEDLDKKLEKISFDANQTTTQAPPTQAPPSQPSAQNQGPDTTMANAPTPMVDPNESSSSSNSHGPMESDYSAANDQQCQHQCQCQSHPRPNRKNYNESHIFDGPETLPPASRPDTNTTKTKKTTSFQNIFGSTEIDPEAEKQAMENRKLYSRRHLKLAQQNHSDIFCLGSDNTTLEQKVMASDVGLSELPPEVPHVLQSRRSNQINLQTSNDNPMLTTYGSMNNSISSIDRRQMASQPTYGITSEQSHRTFKSKSRKFTPAQSSQILF